MNNPTMTTEAGAVGDGREDFDFVRGRWNVAHRRLRRRLVGDTVWEEFAGTMETRPILGGMGNLEENTLALPAGAFRAVALRLFDPQTRRWSIWWVDGRVMHLDPPVHGSFVDGVGTFFGDDVLEGQPIHVRFIWSAESADRLRWEQAFCPHGGDSWEVNWVMSFTRAA